MVADIFQLSQIMGGDDRREVPLLDIISKKTLDRLPHDRIQPVKRFVAEQIIGSRTNAQQHSELFFHTLRKGLHLPPAFQFKIL